MAGRGRDCGSGARVRDSKPCSCSPRRTATAPRTRTCTVAGAGAAATDGFASAAASVFELESTGFGWFPLSANVYEQCTVRVCAGVFVCTIRVGVYLYLY